MADKKNPADPKYEGAYKGKFTQDEIDAVYEKAAMQPNHHEPAPGSFVPTVGQLTTAARKEAEPMEEPMYGGTYEAANVGAVDMRPIIDKKCAAPKPHGCRRALRRRSAEWRPTPRCLRWQMPRQLQTPLGGV